MTPERWQQIEELYHDARAHAPAERQALLAEVCAADEALRREVESLLAFDEQASGFIEMPPDDIAAGLLGAGQARAMLGRTLGHYQLGALLGAGGMGEVYRARDTRLDRDVAVKILPEHLADNAEALRRFEREAKAVAALSHPNILAIHDFGTEQGMSYAVMELLEGETLRARLRGGALAWRAAVEIGLAVAEGLATAHAKGIIHRDLKPENIFLTTAGVVKILDFGIARVKRVVSPAAQPLISTAIETTKPGMLIGTLGYMSPEQVCGEEAEAPSDIFSFGCVLYEMLSAQRPFACATAAETIAAVLKEEPPAMAATGREIPSGLERLIRGCLEKQPSARLQSARELALGLKAMDGHETQQLLPVQARARWHWAALLGAAAVTLLLGVLAWLNWAGWREAAIDSLAVLPLAGANSDEQTEILSDGISESLINSLSQLPQLKRVIARSTAARYKGKEVDPGKVGQELNVRAVLIGKVISRGDDLIVEVELVNTADGARLWGGQYPLKLAGVLAVQAEIAKQISEKLRLRLSGAEQKRLTKRPTENTEAYLLYNSGRYHWGKDTKEELEKSIELYNQAIALDPNYALAWAGKADSYASLSGNYLSSKEAMPRARAAAQKALELDEALAEAHAALAWVKAFYDWDWAEGEGDFKRAIELNPGYARTHNGYGVLLVYLGRFEDAQAEMNRARELDPLSPFVQVGTVWPVLFARRYDQAIEQLHKITALEPDFSNTYLNLAWAYEWKGAHAEAFAPLDKAQSLDNYWWIVAARGYAYAQTDQRDKARQALAELQERAKREQVSGYGLAVIYAGLGEKDQAFAALDRAYQERDEILLELNVGPFLDSLRTDQRFTDLLRRMNLAPLALEGKEQAKQAAAAAPTSTRVEVMRYALELKTAAGATTRATGREPLAAGQRFKFHFTPRESGYLYLIAPGQRNVPKTLLTAVPLPAWGVTTNRLEAGADYSFPAGADNWLRVGSYGNVNTFTVIFAPAPLTAPGWLAAPANRPLTAAEQRELEKLWQQFGKQAPEAETRSHQASVSIAVPAERARSGPLLFDIALTRR